jgi:hypothetical protein
MRWSYGITTVEKRAHTTLPITVRSLRAAGFDSPRIFMDVDLIGTYATWMLGAIELYMRDPTADRYAMFQDDIVCVRDLRQYLTVTPYPDKGYLNLMLGWRNEKLTEGGGSGFVESAYWKPTRQTGDGAQALVFSNEALRTLMRHPHVLDRCRERSVVRRKTNLDGSVCEAMNLSGWKEYVHIPSLVQHIGEVSTLEVPLIHPPAKTFPGEEYSAMQLLQ